MIVSGDRLDPRIDVRSKSGYEGSTKSSLALRDPETVLRSIPTIEEQISCFQVTTHTKVAISHTVSPSDFTEQNKCCKLRSVPSHSLHIRTRRRAQHRSVLCVQPKQLQVCVVLTLRAYASSWYVGRRGAVSGKALNRDATCGDARGYCRHPSEHTRYVAQEANGRQQDANSRRRLCVVRSHELTKAPSKPGKATFQWRNRVAATLDICFRASFV